MVAVGAVGERRARLWLRAEDSGPFALELRPHGGAPLVAEVRDRRTHGDDGTMAFDVPDDVGLPPLSPATRYSFRVVVAGTGELVGEGRFETAPPEGAGEPYAFAFMSCHQPFGPDGSVRDESARMLAALEPALEERGVRYALLIGDQIYADVPEGRRLLSPEQERPLVRLSLEEIRARYQGRYRRFWAFPEMRRLQARRPTWCIWDDHEIVDDWGARRAHTKPEWRRVFEGARRAYVDYQASRASSFGPSPPRSFHHSFVWGQAATFVMDLISERVFVGREACVYGDDQLEALKAFLREHRERPVVFVVLTVPPVYLPEWMVALGERVPFAKASFAARWNAARNRSALDRLLDALREHLRQAPAQKLALLSGDVHQSAALSLGWPSGGRFYQFVSSPFTHLDGNWKAAIARRLAFIMRAVRHGVGRLEVERLAGVGPARQNPFDGLNVGVVHVAGGALRFELLTYDEQRPGAARSAFDSGWV
jgi:alkaline phosphatase D